MSELHDRLNALANRGTPRGFDAVIEAARGTSSLDLIDGAATEERELPTIPFATEEPVRARRTRGRFGSVIAATGVAALVFVGTFAVAAVVGNGGAESPESAVRQLAAAISDGDPLAAADVMAPTELASLHDTVDAAQKKAAELQLVQSASAPLTGLDLSVEGLGLSTDSLGDDYAKVVIDGGTLHARTDKARFSPLMQKVLRDSESNSSETDLADLASSLDVPTFVVTVRQDGRWYASAAYTTLEYIREYNRVSAPAQFGSGAATIATLGATTPDAAVTEAVQALAHNDWDHLFALVPPNEIPLYDYRDALKELIAQNDTQTQFTVEQLTTTSIVQGDAADVVLHASGTSDDGRWSVDGGCYVPPPEPRDTSFVSDGFCVGGSRNPSSVRGALFGLLDPDAQAGSSNQSIKVVRHEGRWFVSPVGTALDVLNDFIGGLDQRGLYTILGIPDQLPPDGTLTLGRPLSLTSRSPRPRVLTFSGRAGEQLLGVASFATGVAPKDYVPAVLSIFGPDGGYVDTGSVFYASPATLPVDGTYKIVIDAYPSRDITVTIWDAEDAPPQAMVGPSDGCVTTLHEAMCSSNSSATTVPDPGSAGRGG
jgi:hypothetical protein